MQNYYRFLNIPNFSNIEIVHSAYHQLKKHMHGDERIKLDVIYRELTDNKVFYDTELMMKLPVHTPKTQLKQTSRTETYEYKHCNNHQPQQKNSFLYEFALYYILGIFVVLLLGSVLV